MAVRRHVADPRAARPFTDTYNRRGLICPAEVLAALRAWPAEDVYLFLEVMPPFEADDAVVLDDLRTRARHWRDHLAQ